MASEEKKKLDAAELEQFMGTEDWYRHWLRKCMYTGGVKFLAEQVGAFWPVDEIAINQARPKVRGEEFQVWVLEVWLPAGNADCNHFCNHFA